MRCAEVLSLLDRHFLWSDLSVVEAIPEGSEVCSPGEIPQVVERLVEIPVDHTQELNRTSIPHIGNEFFDLNLALPFENCVQSVLEHFLSSSDEGSWRCAVVAVRSTLKHDGDMLKLLANFWPDCALSVENRD